MWLWLLATICSGDGLYGDEGFVPEVGEMVPNPVFHEQELPYYDVEIEDKELAVGGTDPYENLDYQYGIDLDDDEEYALGEDPFGELDEYLDLDEVPVGDYQTLDEDWTRGGWWDDENWEDDKLFTPDIADDLVDYFDEEEIGDDDDVFDPNKIFDSDSDDPVEEFFQRVERKYGTITLESVPIGKNAEFPVGPSEDPDKYDPNDVDTSGLGKKESLLLHFMKKVLRDQPYKTRVEFVKRFKQRWANPEAHEDIIKTVTAFQDSMKAHIDGKILQTERTNDEIKAQMDQKSQKVQKKVDELAKKEVKEMKPPPPN